MRTARLVGALGRTLITIGVLTFLFVPYQLWGTDFHESRAQAQLDEQFEDLLASATTTTPPPTTAVPASTTSTTTTLVPLPTYGNGDVIARLEIPAIGLDKKIVQGVSADDLRKGPGHYKSTVMPGQKGNSAIAGHRTTYGAPFMDIDKLEVGDEIRVTTVQGTFTYAVFDDVGDLSAHRIVVPTDTWVLNDFGDNRLTLTACHPKYSAAQRIIVVARLIEQPAPAPPPSTTAAPAAPVDTELPNEDVVADEPGEAAASPDDIGLGWHMSELPSTLLWALITAAMFVAIGAVATRWRRWPTYAIAAVPVVLVVFMLFQHVDRLLPAGA